MKSRQAVKIGKRIAINGFKVKENLQLKTVEKMFKIICRSRKGNKVKAFATPMQVQGKPCYTLGQLLYCNYRILTGH